MQLMMNRFRSVRFPENSLGIAILTSSEEVPLVAGFVEDEVIHWFSEVERSCTVKGKRGKIEMGLVWVQKRIVLRNKTKMLKGSVRIQFLVQVLHLHLRSLQFHCCYCCCQVQEWSIVHFTLFGLLWCHSSIVWCYAG